MILDVTRDKKIDGEGYAYILSQHSFWTLAPSNSEDEKSREGLLYIAENETEYSTSFAYYERATIVDIGRQLVTIAKSTSNKTFLGERLVTELNKVWVSRQRSLKWSLMNVVEGHAKKVAEIQSGYRTI
jgi:hypothetical protein